MIYFSNPKPGFTKNKNKILKDISNIIDSGQYIKGKNCQIFEKTFQKYLKVKHVVGTGNATDALYISIKALNLKKGDEIITTSLTATATGLSILNAGAKLKLIDICDKSYCLDLKLLERKITKKTKAIIIVHLYGQSCNMNYLKKICKKYNLFLIEDCSQSAGAEFKRKKLGTFGDFGCFSFFPTKNLSCIGDGGAITTNNKKFFFKVKAMSQYGWDKNRNAIYQGINSRLDEIQSAILNIKLKNLNRDNKERKLIAQNYQKKINNKKIILPQVVKGSNHVYHLFVIRVKARNKLLNIMKKKRIACGIHYKLPLHNQKIFEKYKSNLKITNKISKEILSIPIYPGLSKKIQSKVINILNNY